MIQKQVVNIILLHYLHRSTYICIFYFLVVDQKIILVVPAVQLADLSANLL